MNNVFSHRQKRAVGESLPSGDIMSNNMSVSAKEYLVCYEIENMYHSETRLCRYCDVCVDRFAPCVTDRAGFPRSYRLQIAHTEGTTSIIGELGD